MPCPQLRKIKCGLLVYKLNVWTQNRSRMGTVVCAEIMGHRLKGAEVYRVRSVLLNAQQKYFDSVFVAETVFSVPGYPPEDQVSLF